MGNCCSDVAGGQSAIGTTATGQLNPANDAVDLFLRSRGYNGLFSQIELSFSSSGLLDRDVLSKNPDANQLPEVDSLPDGFVESTTDPLAPATSTPGQEKPLNSYKDDGDGIYCSVEIPSNSCMQQTEDAQITSPVANYVSESPLSGCCEEAGEKCRSAKCTLKSEKELLKFTLKYQQMLAERDADLAVRDKFESLLR